MSFTFEKLYNRLDKDLDLENEVWIDDDLVIQYTNDAIEKAENLINGVWGDYFLSNASLNVTEGIDNIAFPIDMDGSRVRYMSIKDKDSCYKINKQSLDRIIDVGANSPYRYRIVNGSFLEDYTDKSTVVVEDGQFADVYTEIETTGYFNGTVGSQTLYAGPTKIYKGSYNSSTSSWTILVLNGGTYGSFAKVTSDPDTFVQGNSYNIVGSTTIFNSQYLPDGTPDLPFYYSQEVVDFQIAQRPAASNGFYIKLYPTPREGTTIDFHYLRKLPRIDVDATEAEQLATVIECPVNAFIISYVKTQILEKDGDAKFKIESEKLKGFTEDLVRKVSVQSADGEDTELTASRETMAHYSNAHSGGGIGGFYRR